MAPPGIFHSGSGERVQFLNARERLPTAIPLGRDLDPTKDRLVILISPKSSRPVKETLPDLLRRLRTLRPHQNGNQLTTAASNKEEEHVLEVIRSHIERIWNARVGSAPTELDIGTILELVHVLILDVDQGGAQEREAKTLLRQSVLKKPDQADIVWKGWIENHALFARLKAGYGRVAFQESLGRDESCCGLSEVSRKISKH